MNINETKEKLKKEQNAIYICKINYLGKLYIKAIKKIENDTKYVYYEIENDKIKEIEDFNIIKDLKENYEDDEEDIIY